MAPISTEDAAVIAEKTADAMEKRHATGEQAAATLTEAAATAAKVIAVAADTAATLVADATAAAAEVAAPVKRRWWDRYNVAFTVLSAVGGGALAAGVAWGAFGSTVSAQTKRIDTIEQDTKAKADEAQKTAVAAAELKASNTAEHTAMRTTADKTATAVAKIEEKTGKIEIDVALMKQSIESQSRKLDQVLAKLK